MTEKNPHDIAVRYGEIIHSALKQCVITQPTRRIYKNLEGGCAIGSYILYDKLKELKIKSRFVKGYHFRGRSAHCWVEIEDKIYDVTALQFNVNRKVFVTNKTNKNYSPDCYDEKAIANINFMWHSQGINKFDFSWSKNNLIIVSK